jgi:hypothetical protein
MKNKNLYKEICLSLIQSNSTYSEEPETLIETADSLFDAINERVLTISKNEEIKEIDRQIKYFEESLNKIHNNIRTESDLYEYNRRYDVQEIKSKIKTLIENKKNLLKN